MAKFYEKFICPAPWKNIYYHINAPSPCHIIRNNQLNMTLSEYLESDWLKDIKKDMISGKVPTSCNACKEKEDLKLKSTRGFAWGWDNIGPEPEYEKMWFADQLHLDRPTLPKRLEFRFSNLCNYKCRMCDETSSSEWALEKKLFNIPLNLKNNPEGAIDSYSQHISNITDKEINDLKDVKLLKDLELVCFTGGEPFIIKKYYEYLDFLIENNLNDKITIEIFTNCSVYNPLMIERLMKFKYVDFVMSIDGVGKTAEYIRHGTNWESVEKNVLKFCNLDTPFDPCISTSTSAYTLLDVSNLAKFMMRLTEINEKIRFKGYTVFHSGVGFHNAPYHLKTKMIQQIDESINILTSNNFSAYRNELINIKKQLISMLKNIDLNSIEYESKNRMFYEYTKKLDYIRNENFEEVFNVPLYIKKF